MMMQFKPGSQEERQDDEEVAEMAVAALNSASRRAIDSGFPVIVRIGDELVEVGPQGRTVLKHLQPRQKVSINREPKSS